MVVNQQDAPVTRNSSLRFPSGWSILSVPIALNRAFNGVQFNGKNGAPIFSGTLDANVSAMRIDQCL
jgi:hypothetical protein